VANILGKLMNNKKKYAKLYIHQQVLYKTYSCSFEWGFHFATAVSLIGLKNIEPPVGATANPMPCDDFWPTRRTGSSSPYCKGVRKFFVETANSLRKKKNS
jgi:hypothetical protein